MMVSFSRLDLKITIVLLALGLITRFAFFGHPHEVVFDEVHYGKFVNGYLKGEYFFSGHPPLGPQLLAAGARLGGYRAIAPYDRIGEKLEGNSYRWVRLPAYLAGALIPLAAYALARVIGGAVLPSLLVGAALLFENGLVAQSRFALIDPFLILLGLAGLTSFFVARQGGYRLLPLALAGALLGLSIAVKWSGIGFLTSAGVVVALDAIEALRGRQWMILLRWFGRWIATLLAVSFLFYFATFVLHFYLLPHLGPGDVFMSQEFRRGEKGVIGKFLELNKINYLSNLKNLNTPHPYSSSLISWPFMKRPLYYWGGEDDGGYQRIYFLGNPIVWWGSTLGLLLAFLFWRPSQPGLKIFLLFGYLANMLPFASATRPFFLYHYLPALVFALIASFFAWDDAMNALSLSSKEKWRVGAGIAAAILAVFLFFAPLAYGLSLSERGYAARVWFASWQ